MPGKEWDEIAYPFSNFNGTTVGMKLLIHSITSTVQPLKFGNGSGKGGEMKLLKRYVL